MKSAATTTRNFRTFLLMSQLQAEKIGARIALARHEAGLTQDQLCELGTFSKRALQNWEAGNVIPYKTMNEISRLLARPTDWFLHGEQERDETPGVDSRLEELAAAVDALRRQFEEAAEAVLPRLDAIELQLRQLTASVLPKGAGTHAGGGRR